MHNNMQNGGRIKKILKDRKNLLQNPFEDDIVTMSNSECIRDVSLYYASIFLVAKNLTPFQARGLSRRWGLLSVFGYEMIDR